MELPSNSFPVFIDSNLNTHLALLVSPLHTAAILKKNIQSEHVACFPNIGEIDVVAIRVKRRGAFYHLSDSMIVRSAFDGIKGTCFLYVELAVAQHRSGVGGKFVQGTAKNMAKDVPALIESSYGQVDHCNVETMQMLIDYGPPVEEKQLELHNNVNELLPIHKNDLPGRSEQTSFEQVNSSNLIDSDMVTLEEQLKEDSRQIGIGSASIELGTEIRAQKDDVQGNDELHLPYKLGDKIPDKQVEKRNIEEELKIAEVGDDDKQASAGVKKKKSRKRVKVSHDIHTNDINIEESLPQEKNKPEEHMYISVIEEVVNVKGASNVNAEGVSLPLETSQAVSEITKETKQRRKQSRNKILNKNQLESDFILSAEQISEKSPAVVSRDNHQVTNHDSAPSLIYKSNEGIEKAKPVNEISKVHNVPTEPTALENAAKLDSEVPKDSAPLKKKPSKKSTKKPTVSARIHSEDKNNDNYEETKRNKDRKLVEEPNLEKVFPESVGPLDSAIVESKFSYNNSQVLPDGKEDSEKAGFASLNPSNSYRSVDSLGYPENGKKKSSDESQEKDALTEASSLAYTAKVDYGPATSFDDKKSRRRKKKSSKIKPQNSEFDIQQQLVQPLVKENNELQIEREQRNLGIDSNLLNSDVQDAVTGSPGKVDKPNSVNNKKKLVKKDKNQIIATEGNMDKIPGDDNQSQDSTKLAVDDKHDHRDSHQRHDMDVMPVQRNSSEGKEEQGNVPELPGKENAPNATIRSSAESPPENSPVVIANSDSSKINFIDYFLPKDAHHESPIPASEVSSLGETETRKHHQGKTKKKKQPNMLLSDSTPGVVNLPNSHEHHNMQTKHHITDGDQDLTNPENSSRTLNGGKSSDYDVKKDSNAANMHVAMSSEPLSSQNSHDSSAKLKLHSKKRHLLDETPISRKIQKKSSFSSKNDVQSLNSQDTNCSMNERVEVRKSVKLTRTAKGSIVNVGGTQVPSPVAAGREKELDLAASGDITEETAVQRKRHKIETREMKVPRKDSLNFLDKSKKEDTTVVSSRSIFGGATSDSSDEISNKEKHIKAPSYDSSTSVASDADTEDIATPGYKDTSSGINDDAMNGGLSLQLSLDKILRSTSSYKKAKVLASQSQAEDDSESQSIHEVLETPLE